MKIALLGSTGSIGVQTLDVIRLFSSEMRAVVLTGHSNLARLAEQANLFKPEAVCVPDEASALLLRKSLKIPCEILTGEEGLLACAAWPSADITVNALVGNSGLQPTLAAIRAGKHIALANKETLVTAGALITQTAKAYGVTITPIDSEHSAIMQCLQGNEGNRVEKLILTASGGPFRGWDRDAIARVTAADALRHPTWKMGPKITIDCATLMNKGLEVIEARWLFDVDIDRIEVWVHPQSVVHSMVVFEDGAVMAQLGAPDMRVPIQYALTLPKRLLNPFPRLDLKTCANLTFEPPNVENFPCLSLALDAARAGGMFPAVMNTVNEAAVMAFLDNAIGFYDISTLIADAFKAYTVEHPDAFAEQAVTTEGILQATHWAADFFKKQIG